MALSKNGVYFKMATSMRENGDKHEFSVYLANTKKD
jgi:hypothetical protein